MKVILTEKINERDEEKTAGEPPAMQQMQKERKKFLAMQQPRQKQVQQSEISPPAATTTEPATGGHETADGTRETTRQNGTKRATALHERTIRPHGSTTGSHPQNDARLSERAQGPKRRWRQITPTDDPTNGTNGKRTRQQDFVATDLGPPEKNRNPSLGKRTCRHETRQGRETRIHGSKRKKESESAKRLDFGQTKTAADGNAQNRSAESELLLQRKSKPIFL